jgi:beta-N-acetylhexosaminidase
MRDYCHWRIGLIVTLLLLLWLPGRPVSSGALPGGRSLSGPPAVSQLAAAQEGNITGQAHALLAAMSVEERVGQLFLVPFIGDTALPGSAIAELINQYKVGGVILLAANDNVTDSESAPYQLAGLTNALQRLALGQTAPEEIPVDDTLPPTVFTAAGEGLPLLIAISHEGDGYPHNQILNGLTQIPDQMAVGATWQPRYAQIVGQVVGQELAALGVNMLLGPSLDVLDNPTLSMQNGIGVRSFGGDAFWVGLMGQAYTTGVHTGSDGRVAVIAKHFPGFGGSDRSMDEEVATVRRSLEQLRHNELVPFFAVTGRAPNGQARVDGLMTTHIRYQEFQGNIRPATAPVSFDAQALQSLLQLAEFNGWRQDGGLLVSNSLGVRAVKRFYDDTGQEFPHRRIARDSLLAGNDLLMLTDFALNQSVYPVQLANMKDTITWFQEKYRTDQSFRQRVDEAALRVVQLKLKLYQGEFEPETILVDPEQAPLITGAGNAAMFDLAQAAISLISPSPTALVELLPPGAGDRIVIFTDVRQARQCSNCPLQPLLEISALEERMMALYGPEASGQVQGELISSFSFADLQAFLSAGPGPVTLPPSAPTATAVANGEPDELTTPTPAGPTPTPLPTPVPPPAFLVQNALQNADWILFAMMDSNAGALAAGAVHDFLAVRPDIARSAQVIVFAYNAPYFLDATEISKLTAYFGVYSKSDPFVDASVRTLFQEIPLRGASPVSIEGIGYNVAQATQPDPRQVIELFIVAGSQLQSPPGEEPLEATPGETLRLQTGVIRDRNGRPVPDGTVVQFLREDRIQGFVNVIAERPTVNGVANLDYILEARTGHFRITAVAREARASQELDIVIGESAAVSIRTPTPTPTETPRPTSTPTATPLPASPTPTATRPLPVPTPAAPPTPEEPALRILLSQAQMFFGLLLGLVLTGGMGYLIGRNGRENPVELVRCILWGIIGSLIAYNYYALSLPGAAVFTGLGIWAGLATSLLGGAMGLAAFYYGERQGNQQVSSSK